MRDVTGNHPSGSSFLERVKNTCLYLFHFLQHPVSEISHLPDWSWKTTFWVQIFCAIISGVLSGILKLSFFSVLAGVLLTPIVVLIMVSLLTAFLYYYFQVFENRTMEAHQLFVLATLSSIPFLALQTVSHWVPPITLIGFACSAAILAVGLNENFQVEKKRAIRLGVVLFAIVFTVWIFNKINNDRMETATSQRQMPTEN